MPNENQPNHQFTSLDDLFYAAQELQNDDDDLQKFGEAIFSPTQSVFEFPYNTESECGFSASAGEGRVYLINAAEAPEVAEVLVDVLGTEPNGEWFIFVDNSIDGIFFTDEPDIPFDSIRSFTDDQVDEAVEYMRSLISQ